MAKQSANTESEARRGRPANFPGVETAKRLYNIPVETIQMVEAEAERAEQPLGVTLDRLIRRGFKEANRSRSRRSK